MFNGVDGRRLAFLGAARRFSARCKPGVTDALLSAIYRRGVWKGTNASRHKIWFFFGMRNWMCGVRACENMHTAKPWELAALSLLLEEIMGAFFAPLLVISGAKLYFLGAVLPFALVYFRRWPGVSFIKQCVVFLLKVYVCTKAGNGVRKRKFRFIKPCAHTPELNVKFINHSPPGNVRTWICLQVCPPYTHFQP